MSLFSFAVPATSWTAPEVMEQEEVWGADLYCGLAAQILGREQWRSLKEMRGRCLEGWRVSLNPDAADYDAAIEDAAIYRQSNLDGMRFRLDLSHWEEPTIDGEDYCVQPGDVVLNKLVPIRAVLVTSRAYRHPVDANCLIIRGLDQATAAWVAFCLNQPAYEAYLTQHQGLAVLPRASLRELRQLRLPDRPPEMQRLGERVWELNDQGLESEEALVRCMKEVEAWVVEDLAQVEAEGRFGLRSLAGTGRFVDAASIEDSWVPRQVENADWRRGLRRLGWLPIEKLRVQDGVGRGRLGQVEPGMACVRLGDGDEMLMLKPIEPGAVSQVHRIFEQVLMQGEVLVSTFIFNPRVVFVDRQPETPLYVSDHWARLRFGETAGAWALLLNTKVVQAQMAGLAMGGVQQFMPSGAIDRVMLPNVRVEVRRRWEDCVMRHHQRKQELNREFQAVLVEMQALFRREHRQDGRVGEVQEVMR
ncbi:MAG: hypothetical protein MUF49_01920 [Oculatellaceae cyanobacterium Prado106]|jgi:hypothetical protein|nr:hypothetical protein [Oculatellaceae cyanobacterium Prado106]